MNGSNEEGDDDGNREVLGKYYGSNGEEMKEDGESGRKPHLTDKVGENAHGDILNS